MGPEGAAAAAGLMITIFVVMAALITGVLATRRGGATSWVLRTVQGLTAAQCGILAMGLLLPKSIQRALGLETTGRWLVVAAAATSAVLAVIAWSRRESGAPEWLLIQSLIGAFFASVLGELVFGVFRAL